MNLGVAIEFLVIWIYSVFTWRIPVIEIYVRPSQLDLGEHVVNIHFFGEVYLDTFYSSISTTNHTSETYDPKSELAWHYQFSSPTEKVMQLKKIYNSQRKVHANLHEHSFVIYKNFSMNWYIAIIDWSVYISILFVDVLPELCL